MYISAIIPVLNEAPLVAGAVKRAWDAGADEVIVSDGGSTDETVAIAAQQRCYLIQGMPGRAIQQNAGVRASRGEVLVFLHVDTWLQSGAMGQIQRALQCGHCQGGAFRQRIDARGLGYRLLEWGNAARLRMLCLAYGDQGIFLRRDFFERLGKFPEVPLMEDLRLMRKFRKLARPMLLPGPLHVSARRWEKYGIVHQTVRNGTLLVAEKMGFPPSRLARFYPLR